MSMDSSPQWPPLDPEGRRFVWPDGDEQRVRLARRLFGWAIVGQVDYWIDYAYHLILNPGPDRPSFRDNYASEKEKSYRACFSTLNDTQRQLLLRLVRELADGVAMSILGSLDEFGLGGDRVEISVIGRGSEGEQIVVPITAVDEEMYQQYVSWQEEFGRHSRELTDDLLGPP